MSDIMGIKSDHKFIRLINRLLYEHAQVRDSVQAISNLEKSNLLSRNLSDILSNKNEEMKEESETTLKHIFKYIDRYAERKVLEERAKQPLVMNKLDKLKEEPPVSRRYYANHMMRVDSDGLCYIHKDYCADERVLKNLKNALVEQIIKINPSLVLLPSLNIRLQSNDLAPCLVLKVTLSFDKWHIFDEFVGVKNGGDCFGIDLVKFAKYFSDKVNKIARDKYASK